MECAFCHRPITAEQAALCEQQGSSPHCVQCGKDWEQHLEHEADLQASYVQAKAERVAQAQAEHTEWRTQRYFQRLAEQRETQQRADEWRDQMAATE